MGDGDVTMKHRKPRTPYTLNPEQITSLFKLDQNKGLPEHVIWSAFNTYPTRQLQLKESPLLIQTC